jgi:uncharacterized membrane protein
VSTSRLEAFSDGVIAVAITLLVLNLHVPNPGSSSLGHELLKQWPLYAAYVTSFVTLGIIWINHHAMINRLRAADHTILALNLLLLMWIVLLPFATSLMALYLKQPHGQHLAAALYSGSFLLMSITFAALNRHILFPKAHLMAVELPHERRRQILARGVAGLGPYVLATALAAVSAYVTLAICGAVAVFYALPIASGSER